MGKETYIELIDKMLRGEQVTAADRIAVERWLASDRAQEELYASYRHRWDTTSSDLDPERREKIWCNIRRNMASAEAKSTLRSPLPFRLRAAVRWAAVVLLCAGACFASYRIACNRIISGNEYAVNVALGQKAEITLPDGTQVWLNSGSTLRYGNGYGYDERCVTLTGEAFFDVRKSTQRFVVRAGDLAVTVHGTSFNVKAYEEEETVTATLVSGSIEVRAEDGGREMLRPHDKLTYHARKKSFTKTFVEDVEDVSLWCRNQLVFNGETLGDVAAILHRMYNMEIIFASERAKEQKFTGVIKNNSLMNVLETLSLTAPIRCTLQGNTIVITEDNARLPLYEKNK